jgi:hypothetical protein
MGMDIVVSTDADEQMEENTDFSWDDHFRLHSLSREFCNFMSRRGVCDGEPELDQIGKLTGVDVSPLYEMENYPDDDSLEYHLSFAETEEEIQAVHVRLAMTKERMQNNLEIVQTLLEQLIQGLSKIDDLPAKLLPTEFDSLDNKTYFADFLVDKGRGYIGNNFGQDLRNFKRFLEYAKANGANTIWFRYG